MPENWETAGFGLYVHWPFCQSKCPYCDFNSHVSNTVDQKEWADALCSEISRIGTETQGRTLRSVFFGGGTPSLMAPETVDQILTQVRATWSITNDHEITLEANPTSVEIGKFNSFREAGVNRVSIGVQSLDEGHLKALGRLHSVNEAIQAIETAQKVFDRFSFDLIYARQDQTLENWQSELTNALSITSDHLSLYQLTIEQGTAFGDRYNLGMLKGLPDEDLAADMYFETQTICEKAGLSAYEVSNHAKSGSESQHNLIYWRGGDYVGVGPGAHGRLTIKEKRLSTVSHSNPKRWLDAVQQSGSGEKPREVIQPKDRATEYLMMSLRLNEGTDLSRLNNIYNDYININKINELKELSLVKSENGFLSATAKGRPILNGILRELIPSV